MASYLTCLLVIAACCAHSALGSSIVCDGSLMYLSCPRGQVLYVHSGVYGRTKGYAICPAVNVNNRDCTSTTSTAKVQSACNGQNVCQLVATSDEFGDPCPGIFKYLEVTYACF